MNLGLAVAVCLYELVREAEAERGAESLQPASAGDMERITTVLFDALRAGGLCEARYRCFHAPKRYAGWSAAICHAAQLLAAARVLDGRRCSCYPAVSPDVAAAGGTYVELPMDKACVDGNLVTAPAWPAHPAWLAAFLEVLGAGAEPAETPKVTQVAMIFLG